MTRWQDQHSRWSLPLRHEGDGGAVVSGHPCPGEPACCLTLLVVSDIVRRETGRGWPHPGPGWVPSSQAAKTLGVGPAEVPYLVHQGHLVGKKLSGRVWVLESVLEAYVAEEALWISYAAAAEIVGVSLTTIGTLVTKGTFVRRPTPTRRASLERVSVEKYAEERRAARAEVARRRTAAQPTGPPRDGQVWLDAKTTSLVLGIGVVRVGQLAQADRLPFTEHGGRRWFRRDHVEQVAAARARLRAAREATVSPSRPPQ